MVYEDLKVGDAHQFLDRLQEMRCALESKYQVRVPLIVHLKGSALRVGKVADYSVKLKKGSTFRIFQTKKITGNSKACYCDLGEHFASLKKGDIVGIDYGKHHLRVLGKETTETAINEVGDEYFNISSVPRSQSRFKFNLSQSRWRNKAERKMSEYIQEQTPVNEESESPNTPKKTNLKTVSLFGQVNATSQHEASKSQREIEEKPKESNLGSKSIKHKNPQSISQDPKSFNNLDDSFSEVSHSPSPGISRAGFT